jgi:hypothetical protein
MQHEHTREGDTGCLAVLAHHGQKYTDKEMASLVR